jgi:hypothetical protein
MKNIVLIPISFLSPFPTNILNQYYKESRETEEKIMTQIYEKYCTYPHFHNLKHPHRVVDSPPVSQDQAIQQVRDIPSQT